MHIETTISLSDCYTEFAYVVKALCDHLEISQEDLVFLRVMSEVHNNKYQQYFQYQETIPVKIDIPQCMSPDLGPRYLIIKEEKSPSGDQDANRFDFNAGIHHMELTDSSGKKKVQYWKWSGLRDYYPLANIITMVLKKDYDLFCDVIKDLRHKVLGTKIDRPILPHGMLDEIYKNTILFLEQSRNKKKEYDRLRIPCKRGLLLCGSPGSGKTMTCKWLRQLCEQKGFSHRVITKDDYSKAANRHSLHSIFRLPDHKPGIIFFDDMDHALKSRESGNIAVLDFLTNLDGIEPTEGAIYVFTTNYTSELDKAFIRPGRIDLFLRFKKPNKKLRRQFIDAYFNPEIRDQIDIDAIINQSNDYSYASLEEIRKMFCIDFIDGKKISTSKILQTFEKHRKEFDERTKLGYSQIQDDDDNDDDSYDELFGRHF